MLCGNDHLLWISCYKQKCYEEPTHLFKNNTMGSKVYFRLLLTPAPPTWTVVYDGYHSVALHVTVKSASTFIQSYSLPVNTIHITPPFPTTFFQYSSNHVN